MTEFLLIGFLATFATALLSPILVAKRLANLSAGMSHASLGGLAVALLIFPSASILNEHLLIAIAFICLCALAMLQQKHEYQREASIAVLFSGAMALGPMINSWLDQRFDYTSFLFGNLLLTSFSDLYFLIPLLLCIALGLIVFHREVVYWIFDEHYLYFQNRVYRLIPIAFLILTSIAIIIATKICGIILMTSMLVVPGLLALSFNQSFLKSLGISLLIGMTTFSIGALVSFYLDSPIGASIALTQALTYFSATFIQRRIFNL